MTKYLAVCYPEKQGWFIDFPDINGCCSQAENIQDAFQMAKEALQLHIDSLVDNIKEIPEPKITADDIDKSKTVTMFYIDAIIPKPPVKATISLNPDILSVIDNEAKKMGFTRSGFISYAAKKVIGH